MSQESTFVMIARFSTQASAWIARDLLQEEDIPCVLQNEIMSQLYVPGLTGGIKLWVHPDHVEQASEILKGTELHGMAILDV